MQIPHPLQTGGVHTERQPDGHCATSDRPFQVEQS